MIENDMEAQNNDNNNDILIKNNNTAIPETVFNTTTAQIDVPFDRSVHLKTEVPTDEQHKLITELRASLVGNTLYEAHLDWIDDTQLQRFLIARHYHVQHAHDLTLSALKWREHRQPSKIIQREDWQAFISKECETGKIYWAGVNMQPFMLCCVLCFGTQFT